MIALPAAGQCFDCLRVLCVQPFKACVQVFSQLRVAWISLRVQFSSMELDTRSTPCLERKQ